MTITATLSLAAAALALGTLASAARAEGGSPIGIWINDTGAGAVEITKCDDDDDDGELCGRVVWVKDAAKRKKACGMKIIGDAEPVGGGIYDKGWIYDPKNDMKFDVEITPEGNTLKVMGYLDGDKSLSKTMIWTPAPASLARCPL
jgi:uncharacterized protein (DUF2147 family)